MKESIKLNVPKGIRYISQWNEFKLKQFPHILDKKMPGCGFTEWCITNSDNVILCSPRKILLENKHEQHEGEVFLIKNTQYDKGLNIDKDLTDNISKTTDEEAERIKNPVKPVITKEFFEGLRHDLLDYVHTRQAEGRPIKILVTYDSFRIVKSILEFENMFLYFQVIIDEFQSIFTDSRFKSSTEMNFVSQLQNVQRVCYVSATPMMREYLDLLDDFKDLPFYELDWAALDNTRLIKPNLKVRVVSSIVTKAREIIQTYLDGNFALSYRPDRNIVSNEAVIYVNSVINIIKIIKKCGLKSEQCNILCSNTPENLKRIQKKLGKKFEIGKVPLKGKPHKMFTFCTRTVYLGADFYSTCARSFILSDANVQTLAVDISLDLPQILGRQRLNENPWRNEAEFYYKTITDRNKKKIDQAGFEAEIKKKLISTEKLLSAYSTALDDAKDELSGLYEREAARENYKLNYIAVNRSDKSKTPVQNKLVIIAEKRAFDIQNIDYQDRFAVFSSMDDSLGLGSEVSDELSKFYEDYNRDLGESRDITRRLKYICEYGLSSGAYDRMLTLVDEKTRSYLSLGFDRLRANGYRVTDLNRELSDIKISSGDNLINEVYKEFPLGKYNKAYLKDKLQKVYNDIGLNRKAKATDLEEWFELRIVKIKDDIGKWTKGFELIAQKKIK